MECAAESIILQFLVLALMLAGLAVGWPMPAEWNLLQNQSFHNVLVLALMLAGLSVGWPLPGGWNLLQNRSFYRCWGLC